MLAIHHLVVDGVSWRVLLADLELAYATLRAGEPVQLPPKTSSFKDWAERLVAYAQGPALAAEAATWGRAAAQPVQPVPRDMPDGSNTEDQTEELVIALSAEATEAGVMDAEKMTERDLWRM